MFVVVSYDVPDDKRRARVMKTLKDFGRRVQYSVFECDLSKPEQLKALRGQLRAIIEPVEDDVRFYGLCEKCVAKRLRLGHPREPLTRWDEPRFI